MPVTIYYLQLLPDTQIVPANQPDHSELQIVECRTDAWEVNRFLYGYIGRHWQWADKLTWSEQQWQEYVADSRLRTWMLLSEGTPAGYFELYKHPDDSVEIAYFGLANAFVGQQLGGWLLSEALKLARQWSNQRRIWVHTCSLDHPAALKNYQARGMQLYDTKQG